MPSLVKVWRQTPPGNCMNFQLCRAAKAVVARTVDEDMAGMELPGMAMKDLKHSQTIAPKLKVWRKLSQKGPVPSLPDVCRFVRFLHIGMLTSTFDGFAFVAKMFFDLKR